MSIDSSGPPRRRIINLQLAPMIDIFTLIIVFLLMSIVLGQVSVVMPADMKSAKSSSKENVEAAPQVIIHKEKVILSIIQREMEVKSFLDPSDAMIADLKSQVGGYIKNTEDKNKGSVVNINVVADKATTYDQVFAVVKVLRLSGFQSVLFIAEGDPAAASEQKETK